MILTSITILLFSSCLITAWHCEGENCTVEATNSEGQCIQIHECEYAKGLIRENKRPETCGFLGLDPLVCCPAKQNQISAKPGTVAQQKCDLYYDIKLQVFAIDIGQQALPKEFPHMAAVGYVGSEKDILWLCGGTLISHYFVISAAHCAYSLDFGPAKWVRLGDLDLKNTTEDADPRDIRISQTYVHPQYKASSHYHDIALFKLEQRVSFALYYKAACLQTEKNLPGKDLQATGWGKLGIFGDSSSHLMKVNLSIVDHGTCSRRYANVAKGRRLKNGILDETQMCAGNAEGGDTCPGDSGGPLHYRVEEVGDILEHFVVAGVTSFGKGCGGENSAGVYTRVSAYIEWIENTVWGQDFDELL